MGFGGFKAAYGRTLFGSACLLLLLANVALAQKETGSNIQNLTVYAEPRPDSLVLTQLTAVTDIISGRQRLDLKTRDGNDPQWYEVEYEHEGRARSGYMLTTLRIGGELRIGEVSFHHVMYREPEKPANVVVVYARNQAGLLSSLTIEVVAAYSTLSQFKQPEGRPAEEKGMEPTLENVQAVIELHADTDACGYPDIRHYFAWTGSELAALPRAASFIAWSGDKGINCIETIIWPGLGAPEGYIIKLTHLQDVLSTGESDYDYEVVGNSYATGLYQWDGRQARLIEQKPAILGWYDNYKFDR